MSISLVEGSRAKGYVLWSISEAQVKHFIKQKTMIVIHSSLALSLT